VGPGRQPQRRCVNGESRLAAAWVGRPAGPWRASRGAGPRIGAHKLGCGRGWKQGCGLLLAGLARGDGLK
jgi:hypothetical protein